MAKPHVKRTSREKARAQAELLFRGVWGRWPRKNFSPRRRCIGIKEHGEQCQYRSRRGFQTCGKHPDQDPRNA